MKKIIGIISYLPDNPEIRAARFTNLLALLDNCYSFNIPIMIIAQNWKRAEVNCLHNDVIALFYPKLGITGARRELRQQFLNSGYDYLIMLDDDCVLQVSPEGIDNYLKELDEHPGCVGEFRNTLFKLYAISKEIYSQVDLDPEVSAEEGIGFEDTIFVNKVRAKFPDKVFAFKCRGHGINEVSINALDPLSTWYTNQDIPSMLDYTHDVVNNLRK